MKIKDFLEAIEYKITNGEKYHWNCYGDNAYILEYWNGSQDGHSCEIIFDTVNHTVYECIICDYANSEAYRWINPEYKSKVFNEASLRGVNKNEAWDSVDFCDMLDHRDFLETLKFIIGTTNKNKETIQIDLSDDEWYRLMRLAHAQDITLNQLVEQILVSYIENLSSVEQPLK